MFGLRPGLAFCVAALVATACGAGSAAPDSPPAEQANVADAPETEAPPESACPLEGAEEVEITLPTATGESLMVNGLDHDRIWNNDLNGDGMPDMVLQQRGACNPDDECMVTVWLGCTPNTFTAVWGPDFAYELYILDETHEHDGVTWRTVERAMSDGGDGMVRTVLYFDGNRYAPAP
jgi:hypothetical protein